MPLKVHWLTTEHVQIGNVWRIRIVRSVTHMVTFCAILSQQATLCSPMAKLLSEQGQPKSGNLGRDRLERSSHTAARSRSFAVS